MFLFSFLYPAVVGTGLFLAFWGPSCKILSVRVWVGGGGGWGALYAQPIKEKQNSGMISKSSKPHILFQIKHTRC